MNRRAAQLVQGVYPRVCGGTVEEALHWQRHRGLSPRVRGNPMSAMIRGLTCGSIPACAGEPNQDPVADASDTVYPRVCGGTGDGPPSV